MIRTLEDAQLRRGGFRIGVLHGKQLAGKDDREYKIQREVYLVGNLRMNVSKTRKVEVRIIAYEVPLGKTNRSYSVDLIGYDQEFNIYLIEVKRENNRETLQKDVVEQINSYYEMFRKIKSEFEKEFAERFLFPVRFKSIVKVILAPRQYYQQNGRENESLARRNDGDVLFGYFGNIARRGETDLVRPSKMWVDVSFYNPQARWTIAH